MKFVKEKVKLTQIKQIVTKTDKKMIFVKLLDEVDYSSEEFMLKFFDNYRQRHSFSFRYLLVPEQHKDGAFHFHGLFCGVAPSDLVINEHGYLDFIPYRDKFGFCSLSEIKDLDACAGYVTKYISKDMFQTVPEPRTHLYFCSKGLNTDKLLQVGHLDTDFVAEHLQSCDTEFCIKYYSSENVFNGYIHSFVNTIKPTDLKNIDVAALKKKTLFKFCYANNILISPWSDLDKLYDRFSKDIISYNLSEYDRLKSELQSQRKLDAKGNKYIYCEPTEEEWEIINSIFVHNAVSDYIHEPVLASHATRITPDNSIQSGVQLCIFNKMIGVEYNDS